MQITKPDDGERLRLWMRTAMQWTAGALLTLNVLLDDNHLFLVQTGMPARRDVTAPSFVSSFATG